MTSALIQTLDNALLALCGLGYFRLTRDATILDRADYLMHYVREAPQPRVSILDVGCGSSATLLWLAPVAEKVASYMGVDGNVEGQDRRFRNFPIRHAFRTVDLDKPWDFGRFDLVSCLEVLEHLIDDRSMFAKLCSQVAPHGRLLISTPSAPFVARMGKLIPGFDHVSPTQDGDHVRMGYTADEFRALAEANNMEILSVDWLSRYEAEELRQAFGVMGPSKRLWQNLRYPRGVPEEAWVIGGDPAVHADTYWSIGIYMKHKDA
ncbi:class I SAM-dependent methyltransferase [Vineibacter terrae]|uniref:class I SAM-dependent methyltransferase n=1 Tax=Vineibacter terrae TaxID=2586908 RepID=UPI002E3453D8|nr:class I SAM-dependent methyltransferase [Vineibacter terrae]HEX2890136.1 class I SAM-dependent methyltransferase [Vineibacter terrae]